MRDRIIAITAIFLGATPHLAPAKKYIVNPNIDYINTANSVLTEYGVIKKLKFKRLELRLSPAEGETVFLSFGPGSKIGPVWTAYSPEGERGYLRIDGVQFRSDSFHAGVFPELAEDGGLLVLYRGKGGGPLHRYTFVDGLAKMEKVRDMDFSDPADLKLMGELFGRDPLQPLPQEYFDNPPYEVLSVSEIRKAAEASRLEQAQNKLPGEAPTGEVSKIDETRVDLGKQKAAARQDGDQQGTGNLLIWLYVVGGIVLLAGIAWLARKARRKNSHF